jgi:hypothetical protein
MICKFCNKLCKNANSHRNHERLCKLNPDRQYIKSAGFAKYNEQLNLGERTGTNQYIKAKEMGIPKPIVSQETRNKISNSSKIAAKNYWNDKTRKQRSDIMKRVVRENPDSYSSKNVCGRTKKIIYNGFELNGSWELIVAKWLDDNNINWTNKITPFTYIWNGNDHLYFPDFYLPDYDRYIEVKGYERERDRHKWKVVPNLVIIKQKEIKLIKQDLYPLALIMR